MLEILNPKIREFLPVPPMCPHGFSIFDKKRTTTRKYEKQSAKTKLVPAPPESDFLYHFLGSFFGPSRWTGTGFPVEQELTLILFLATERSIFQQTVV